MVCLIVISLAFSIPAPAEVSAAAEDATVNLADTKQSISGFGASSAWCGALSDSIMNSLYKNLGYSILRLRIEEGISDEWKSGNYSAWTPELSNAQKASVEYIHLCHCVNRYYKSK